ncbi:MAG: ATP-binding protein, partial [Rhodospirillales bacterium]
IGKTVFELGLWREPRQRLKLVKKIMRDGNVRDFVGELMTKDGVILSFLFSGETIELDGKHRMLLVITDITERQKAEISLKEAKEQSDLANRTKTEFLANMSHELRTPLNSIIGFSEIMAGETFGPLGRPQYQEYARDIKESGAHLLHLINDILDVSRIESDELALSETRIDVAHLIGSCRRLVSGRAQKAGLRIEMEPQDDLPALLADERRLKQILINLLSNAIKFTPEGGTVTIKAGLNSDGRYQFTISDTGIGIAPENIETALSTFGQADGSLARIHEGAGLGLPLSRSLAELHGGELLLESAPGVGTTVTVFFPPERVILGMTSSL